MKEIDDFLRTNRPEVKDDPTFLLETYRRMDQVEGIKAEVIDIRTLFPLDKDIIRESLEKTNKVIIITEETKRGGYGGEISATIGEEMFDLLDAPIARIGSLDTPVPFAPNLEQYYMPNERDIVVAAKKMF